MGGGGGGGGGEREGLRETESEKKGLVCSGGGNRF